MNSLIHYTFRALRNHQNVFHFRSFPRLPAFFSRYPQRRHLSSLNKLFKSHSEKTEFRNLTGMYYAGAFLFFFLGSSYAAVPLYRMFCSAIGVGGTTLSPNLSKSHDLTTLGSFPIKVNFLSNTSLTLPWSFIPSQPSLEVRPGETALAFYTAHNKTNQPIIGIATYNVVPAAVAPYFNKIQCFCFEEQPLGPNETVDMPVFFFIDPAIEDDPVAAQYKDVTLSYTFFKAKEPL